MADNTVLNAGAGGDTIATDDLGGGIKIERVKVNFGVDGVTADVSSANPLPVTGPLTDAQLRAVAVPVSGTVTASGPLTDTQLRATPVPVSGTVTANIVNPKAATSTRTQVASAAADTLILAANANRLGATVANDDANELYLGLGTTAASLTNYTVIIQPKGYYEIPFDFTGQIRGIWSVDGAGSARVTELTA